MYSIAHIIRLVLSRITFEPVSPKFPHWVTSGLSKENLCGALDFSVMHPVRSVTPYWGREMARKSYEDNQ